MVAAYSSKALVPIYQITRCHIPEDHILPFINLRMLNVRSIINLSKLATNYTFNSWQGQQIFLLSTASRLSLGHTKPPIELVPDTRDLSLRVKWQRHKNEHSPTFIAMVMHGATIHTPTPIYTFMAWCFINYAQGKCYFHYLQSHLYQNIYD